MAPVVHGVFQCFHLKYTLRI